MAYADYKNLLNRARSNFIEGQYASAENLLQEVLLIDNKVPEVFHMLATIFYDRGQFNKAINYFKRALEIDPQYTDASVGLSIILNDLGRYEEGKQIFTDAQSSLKQEKQQETSTFIEDRLVSKHLELGDLYFQSGASFEAMEQYQKALNLSGNKPDIRLKMADCYEKMGENARAQKELKLLVSDFPTYVPGLLRMARHLHERQRFIDALDYWERVLAIEPHNREAHEWIQRAQKSSLFPLT